jgi:undecaprenyl-phosphate galactose phosphotransferase
LFFSFPNTVHLNPLKPLWLPILYIFFIGYEKLYAGRAPFWKEVRQLWKAAFFATIASFAIVSIGKLSAEVSRTVIVLSFFISMLVFPFFRLLSHRIIFLFPALRPKAIIIGAGSTAVRLIDSLAREKYMSYEIKGLFDDKIKKGTVIRGYKVLGRLDEINPHVNKQTEVFIAIPKMPPQKIGLLVSHLQKKAARVSFVPDLFGIPIFESDIEFFFHNRMIVMSVKNNLKSPFHRFMKRSFDIFASLILMIPLLPLIGILTLLIRFDSRGPVFFSQKRVGFGGKQFKCFKFRSMYMDAESRLKTLLKKDKETLKEWKLTRKLKNDPRITRIGRFLRKTSLDELPQIFNVLKGDMSLVGPRPVPRDELEEQYRDFAEYYLLVRPGITGLWQSSGRSDLGYDKRISLDVWYVTNWNLWLDIIILMKTPRVVFERKGAY